MIIVIGLIVMIRMVVMIIVIGLIVMIRMVVMIIIFFRGDERGQRDRQGRTFVNRVKSCQKPLF